jgi:hypothetical protein
VDLSPPELPIPHIGVPVEVESGAVVGGRDEPVEGARDTDSLALVEPGRSAEQGGTQGGARLSPGELAAVHGRVRLLARAYPTASDVVHHLGVEGSMAYISRGVGRPSQELVDRLAQLVDATRVRVEQGDDGRFVVDAGAGERLHVLSDGELDFRLLRLPGSGLWLRFDRGRQAVPESVWLTRSDGEPVQDVPERVLTRAEGFMAVRLPVPGTTDQARWAISRLGVLLHRKFPVTGPGVPPGVKIRIDYYYPRPQERTEGVPDAVTHGYQVVQRNAPEVGFTAGPLPDWLAGVDPDGVVLTDTAAGRRFHLDGWGRVLSSEVLVAATPSHVLEDEVRALHGCEVPAPQSSSSGAAEPSGGLPDPVRPEERAGKRGKRLSPKERAMAQGRLRLLARALPKTDDLGSCLKVDRRTVQHYLSGKYNPSGPVAERLAGLVGGTGVVVTPGGGGRFVVDVGAGERLYVRPDGGLDFRLLRLPGSGGWLRFDRGRSLPSGVVPLVGVDGVPVPGALVKVTDHKGRLTVHLLTSEETGIVEWSVSAPGVLLHRRFPVTGQEAPPGVEVGIDYRYPWPVENNEASLSYQVLRQHSPAVGFTAGPLPDWLAGVDPDGVVLTDTAAGRRFHLDGWGRVLSSEVLVAATPSHVLEDEVRALHGCEVPAPQSSSSGAAEPSGGLPDPVRPEERAGKRGKRLSPKERAMAQGRLRLLARALPKTDDLGSCLKVDRRTVQHYLSGKYNPSGPVAERLAGLVGGTGVVVTPGAGGRFVVDVGAGERLYVRPDGGLDFRLLRLPGSGGWLRFDREKSVSSGVVPLVGVDGVPVPGLLAEVTNRNAQLTVRLPMPGGVGMAQWSVSASGVLLHREFPVTGLGVPPGVEVGIDYRYPRPGEGTEVVPDAVTYLYQVLREGRRVAGTAGPLPDWLAEAHPDGVALTATSADSAGRVFCLDGWGRLLGESSAAQRQVPPTSVDLGAPLMSEEDNLESLLNLLYDPDLESMTGLWDELEPVQTTVPQQWPSPTE